MTRLEALTYVYNTGGCATRKNFVEDWEPVGSIEWMLLVRQGLVEERSDKIFLTLAGVRKMYELKDKEKAR